MNGTPWGGSEDLWSETALALRRRGHDVAASVLRWPVRPTPLQELADQGVAVAFRAKPRFPARAAAKLLARFFPTPIPYPDWPWLKRSRADLVVVSQGGPWDGVSWMLACARLGLPYCAIVHAHSEQWWPLDERLADIRRALSGARKLFFVSHANRKMMELQCGSHLPHAEVVANPCKVDRAAAVPWPVDDGRVHFACVGRLAPAAKGQDLLLQVFAQPKWKERPATLHLYGSGPAHQSIASLAALLGVANVVFHGHVSDVREIWRTNHVLVLPSRFEGLPLTIAEAMLCGRPVITTAVAGNTELVTDGVNGFVAAAPTVALLDDAIERAWACRANWPAFGARARDAALRFLPPSPVQDFADSLLRLVATRDGIRNSAYIPPAIPAEPAERASAL